MLVLRGCGDEAWGYFRRFSRLSVVISDGVYCWHLVSLVSAVLPWLNISFHPPHPSIPDPFVHPSSWPVSHSNVLPDPSCWCLQMNEVMVEESVPQETGRIHGCVATRIQNMQLQERRHEQLPGNRVVKSAVLSLDSIKLSSSVCWLVGRWWGQIAQGMLWARVKCWSWGQHNPLWARDH